jgi:hypothetical protein
MAIDPVCGMTARLGKGEKVPFAALRLVHPRYWDHSPFLSPALKGGPPCVA